MELEIKLQKECGEMKQISDI